MSTQKTKSRLDSPCIGICQVKGRHGFCSGCWRSLGEIARWTGLTPQQRKEILDKLDDRKSVFESTH